MFVSEIVPGMWVCDYEVINTTYFNNKNITLYIRCQGKEHFNARNNYNHKNIYIPNLSFSKTNDPYLRIQNKKIQENLYKDIRDIVPMIEDNLIKMKNVVIYSKYGIQKAATVACAYLLDICNINVDAAIQLMISKEPLFFQNPLQNIINTKNIKNQITQTNEINKNILVFYRTSLQLYYDYL
jgi:protein-tyrosine phosphatase